MKIKYDLVELAERHKSGEKLRQKSYNDGYELVLIIDPNTGKASWWFRGKGTNRGINFKLACLKDVDHEQAKEIRDHVQAELNRGVHHKIALETFEKTVTVK